MLAIVATHPIQYQVPIWQALAKDGRVPFEVWYLTDFGMRPSLDVEFGKTFAWDIDTLGGYPHRLLQSVPGATPVTQWRCRARERLRDRLRDSGVKAVWIQGWHVAGYWQAAWAAKAVGAELWLRAESNDLAPPTAWWKRPVKRLALGSLFSRVDRFLTIGSANRRLYESYGVARNRLYSAPYAIDNERFARQAEAFRPQRSELRRRWGIPDDAYCVLFCGKFLEKKRPLDLVEAARRLRQDGRNIHLLFVGSGELDVPLRQACEVVYDAAMPLPTRSAAASAGRPPASFAGFLNQTEISSAYVAADWLVLPSDHGETWGLVVNEALTSGLPCVVSDACGCAEDLAPGRTYPLGDVAALASMLTAMFSGHHLSETAQALPSFDESVSAVVQIYANMNATG